MPNASQAPRTRVAPRAAKTYGDIAANFAGDYGLTPDPWQQIVLDDWLGEKGGKWSSLTCGLSVPRQNGKNALIEIRELFGMVGRGEKILHTAHEVKTARKAFKRLQHFFGTQKNDPAAKFPELNARVEDVRNVNGQEAIYLKNGGSVEVVARSKNSARGFTVDVLIMDEAQEMGEDDLEAMMPTTSSAPTGNPQWIFTGTPPGPNANGEIFTRVRNEAIGGKSVRLSWHEWSAEPDVDLDDREVWRLVNPALINGRLQFEVIEGERARFSEDGFARERLGVWASASSERGVIPFDAWQGRRDDGSLAVDRFTAGIEVGPDLAHASVSIAGQRVDGDWHIDLAENRSGGAWIVGYVKQLVEANPQIRGVVGDVGGPLAALLETKARSGRTRYYLTGAGVEVMPLAVKELGAACTQMLAAVVAGTVHHVGATQMDTAVKVAGKRALGDTGMWVYSRKSATSDITPIQSATYALWGAQNDNVKRPTSRPEDDGSVVVL